MNATSYMQGFNITVYDCRHFGKNFDDEKVLMQFLDGLNNMSTIYEAQIKPLWLAHNMVKLNPTLQLPMMLQYIQSQLLAVNEN